MIEAKFFELFRILHSVGKQAYKLEFLKRWRIYDIFYMSLLEQNTTKKRLVDKKILQIDFDIGNDNRKYKIEVI